MAEISAAAIKKMILAEGIDMVAIADATTLILASPARPATALIPGAKGVIVLAVAHSLGAVHNPDIRLWTRNKMQTSRLLDQVAEKVGRYLEKEGWLSLPISADKPAEIHKFDPKTKKKFRHTKVIGQFSLKHAAVSAGMGQIGRSNLLLTENFGPHQRLGGIITTAVLEPDPRKDLELCLPGCSKCEEACPVGALKKGKYDIDPCFNYWMIGFERMRPKSLKEWPAYIRMLISHNRRRDWFIETGQNYITDVDYCIECMKACPVGNHWKKIRPRIES